MVRHARASVYPLREQSSWSCASTLLYIVDIGIGIGIDIDIDIYCCTVVHFHRQLEPTRSRQCILLGRSREQVPSDFVKREFGGVSPGLGLLAVKSDAMLNAVFA
jgi:hypothetical protein